MTFADGYKLGEFVNTNEVRKKSLKVIKKRKCTKGKKNKNENKPRFGRCNAYHCSKQRANLKQKTAYCPGHLKSEGNSSLSKGSLSTAWKLNLRTLCHRLPGVF